MEKELQKRKHPRLKQYDYSIPGAYFITICINERKNLLGTVGRGLAPAEEITVRLSKYGEIIREELLKIKQKYENVDIKHYVIMPDHIHLILELVRNSAGASPRPTVMDIICAFKSVVTAKVRANGFIGKFFQTSFYDHIIRNKQDYDETVKYIYENPARKYYEKM